MTPDNERYNIDDDYIGGQGKDGIEQHKYLEDLLDDKIAKEIINNHRLGGCQ